MNKEEVLQKMEQALAVCTAKYEEERHEAYGSTIYSRRKEHMEYLLTLVRDAADPAALAEKWAAELQRLDEEIEMEDRHPTFCEEGEYYYGAALSGRRGAIREFLTILQDT